MLPLRLLDVETQEATTKEDLPQVVGEVEREDVEGSKVGEVEKGGIAQSLSLIPKSSLYVEWHES